MSEGIHATLWRSIILFGETIIAIREGADVCGDNHDIELKALVARHGLAKR